MLSQIEFTFLKHVSVGLLRELEENISLNKLLPTNVFFQKCFFIIGKLVYKQDTRTPMGIDPAPF